MKLLFNTKEYWRRNHTQQLPLWKNVMEILGASFAGHAWNVLITIDEQGKQLHFEIKEEGFTLENILALITMSHGYTSPGIGALGVGIRKTAGKMTRVGEPFVIRSLNKDMGRFKFVWSVSECIEEPEVFIYSDKYKLINEKLMKMGEKATCKDYPTNEESLQESSTYITVPLHKITPSEIDEIKKEIIWSEQLNICFGKINYTIAHKHHTEDEYKLEVRTPLLPSDDDCDIKIEVRVGMWYLPKGYNVSGPRWMLIASGSFEDRDKKNEPQLYVLQSKQIQRVDKNEYGIEENLLDWGREKWEGRKSENEKNHAHGLLRLVNRYDKWEEAEIFWADYFPTNAPNLISSVGGDKMGLYFIVGNTTISTEPTRWKSLKGKRIYDRVSAAKAHYKSFVTYENIKPGLDLSVIKADAEKVKSCEFQHPTGTKNILDIYVEKFQGDNYIYKKSKDEYKKRQEKIKKAAIGLQRLWRGHSVRKIHKYTPEKSYSGIITNMKHSHSKNKNTSPHSHRTSPRPDMLGGVNVKLSGEIAAKGFQGDMEGHCKNPPSSTAVLAAAAATATHQKRRRRRRFPERGRHGINSYIDNDNPVDDKHSALSGIDKGEDVNKGEDENKMTDEEISRVREGRRAIPDVLKLRIVAKEPDFNLRLCPCCQGRYMHSYTGLCKWEGTKQRVQKAEFCHFVATGKGGDEDHDENFFRGCHDCNLMMRMRYAPAFVAQVYPNNYLSFMKKFEADIHTHKPLYKRKVPKGYLDLSPYQYLLKPAESSSASIL